MTSTYIQIQCNIGCKVKRMPFCKRATRGLDNFCKLFGLYWIKNPTACTYVFVKASVSTHMNRAVLLCVTIRAPNFFADWARYFTNETNILVASVSVSICLSYCYLPQSWQDNKKSWTISTAEPSILIAVSSLQYYLNPWLYTFICNFNDFFCLRFSPHLSSFPFLSCRVHRGANVASEHRTIGGGRADSWYPRDLLWCEDMHYHRRDSLCAPVDSYQSSTKAYVLHSKKVKAFFAPRAKKWK